MEIKKVVERYFSYIIIIFIFTSCIPFEPSRSIHVVIEKDIIQSIDSISLYDSSNNIYENTPQKVIASETDYYLHLTSLSPCVKLKLSVGLPESWPFKII